MSIEKIIEVFGELVELPYVAKHSNEHALYCMLRAYKDDLPLLNTKKDYQYFHKAFRQVDVIDKGEGLVDMAFWHLLNQSRVFWACCEEVFNDQDAVSIYKKQLRSER